MALYDADRIRWSLFHLATGDPFDNPSFEIADTEAGVDIEAVPASWVQTGNANLFASAAFGPPLFYAEAYEALWGDNQDALADLNGVGATEQAVFGVDPATVYEGYESQWGDNEDALADFSDSGDIEAGAFDAAADEHEDFEGEWVSRHDVVDRANGVTVSYPTGDPVGTRALANALKAAYNLHIADATVHSTADSTNTITSPDATDLSTTIALCVELWSDVWLHFASDTYHRSAVDPQVKPTWAAPTDYDECALMLLGIVLYYNSHLVWRSNSELWNVDEFEGFGASPSNWYAMLWPSPDSPTEDYESDWDGNESALDEYEPSDIDAAPFTLTASTQDFEDYDSTIQLAILLTPGAGAAKPVNRTHGFKVDFTGTMSGGLTLVVQVKRFGSSTWIDKDTITATPATTIIDAGYVEVRINTTVGGSGTVQADLDFVELEAI